MNIGLQTQLFIFHSMLNPFNRRKEVDAKLMINLG